MMQLYGAISTDWRIKKCRESVVECHIDPTLEKSYQVAIPSFFTTHATIDIVENGKDKEYKKFSPQGNMTCELTVYSESGKELLHRDGFYPGKKDYDVDNFPNFIRLKESPASGKIIFRVSEALNENAVYDVKVIFTPYILYGCVVIGVCKILGTIFLVVSIITGIILYKMTRMDRLIAREKTPEC